MSSGLTSVQIPQNSLALEVGGGIDVMQIYPGVTNNLNFLSYSDPNGKIENSLCCSCISNLTGSYFRFLFGFIVIVCVFLALGFVAMLVETIIFGYYVFFSLGCLIFLFFKLYVLYQLRALIKVTHNEASGQASGQASASSMLFHVVARRFYFAFFGDSVLSLTFVIWWAINLFQVCVQYRWWCEYYTSFDRRLVYATLTWFVMLPLVVYLIVGFFAVFRIRFGDFEVYFKFWTVQQFKKSKEVKFCLDYHHAAELPAQYTVLCDFCSRKCTCCAGCCCNGCRDFVCCCDEFCNTCDGVNTCCCCGANCCSNGVKCTLIAISVWQVLVGIFGLFFVCRSLMYSYYYFSLQDLFVGVSLFLYHFLPGYWTLRLVNFRYNCCLKGLHPDGSIMFHVLSLKALKSYSALAALWGFFFIGAFVFCIYWLFYAGSFYGLNIMIPYLLLGAFIAWLPFEAIKLIDTFIKLENYDHRHAANGIDMDSIDWLQSRGGGSGDGAEPVRKARQTKDDEDAGILDALQKASTNEFE